MKITKEDVIKLMKKTINDTSMMAIDHYERAITVLSNDSKYEGKEEDWNTIMHHINDYDDFKIDNVYQIIYDHQPFNFMKTIMR